MTDAGEPPASGSAPRDEVAALLDAVAEIVGDDDVDERMRAEAGRMLEAIVSGWSTFTLYPNPAGQPAFTRCLEALADFQGSALALEVGAGAFLFHGEPLPTGRDGAERLATQLFLHEVEALYLRQAPSAHDLLTFYEAVSAEEGELAERGGVEAVLELAEVSSLAVRRRRLLGETEDLVNDYDHGRSSDGSLEGKERSPVAAKFEQGAEPHQVAEDLVEQSGGDPDLAAKIFVDAFDELYWVDSGGPATMQRIGDMLLPYLDADQSTPPIVTLVDTYFCLPEDVQVRVFEQFLDSLDDGVHRLFVDQFSGEELQELQARLDRDQAAALLEYARDALDKPEGDLEDLLPPLRSAREAKEHRKAAADSIAAILAGDALTLDGEAATAQLTADLEAAASDEFGWRVLADLLGCEHRDHRFKRLLRIWTGRLAAAVRMGDFGTALAGIKGIEDDPPYPPDRRRDVEEALGRLASADLIEAVLGGGEPGPALEVVTALGPAVVDKLVEQLAGEENAGRRKVLVELLGSMAERNLRHLVSRLDDPRWYVVRNLATVLGRSRRKDAAAPLRKLMAHSDYRVRAEALRALIPIKAADLTSVLIEALGDSNERIRQSALAYLRQERPAVDDLLEVISSGNLDGDTAASLVKIIGRQPTPEARSALEQIGSRRFAVRGNERVARQAAKEELKRLRQ